MAHERQYGEEEVREREAQMEQVATKTLAMLQSGPADVTAEQDYETGPPEHT